MKAYCYRSGQIVFGQRIPAGAILIAEGKAQLVRNLICAVARHAYDGKTLLVPGIPEAESEEKAMTALENFLSWLGRRTVEGVSIGGVKCA